MINFDEQKILDSVNGALKIRPQIEVIADQIWDHGFDNIFFIGVGGTYASGLQTESHIKEHGSLPFYVEIAGEYLTTGNKRLTADSLIVFATVSGTTEEVVKAVTKIKNEFGSTVMGFVDKPGTPLANLADYCISYPENEQLKLFMFADRLMLRNGDISQQQYDDFYKNMDEFLAAALVETGKLAENFALEFAQRHHDDSMHYFVGAGNQWGSTYSYGMCYWEEQHWRLSKTIHAAEFFHGTLEIIERDSNVTVFIGEDSQRTLCERVANFLPRICARYTFVDTKDYPLTGIVSEYRGDISHLVTRAIMQRVDAHIEQINCHPMEIRRYYRQLDY